jgi:magnesium chelatase subunit D
LARGIADLLLQPNQQPAPFVNLPLGTTEDRLLGTLNLEQVLQQQQVRFQPGLLAQAHGGVLYVDEVNLLPDVLVDLLLDVSARGVNVVERDGVSHQHPAQFVLIGTMNPDEGELRPQILDRFGLALHLNNEMDVAQRVAIMQQREAYERDPVGFVQSCAEHQTTLQAQVNAAQQALPQVRMPAALYTEVAQRCIAAGVEGFRADGVWLQAALAHAAWHGRTDVTSEDIDAVGPWVLVHRQTTESPPPPPPQAGGQAPQTSPHPEQSMSEGDWGAMPPQPQATRAADLPAAEGGQVMAHKPALTPASRRRGSGGQGVHAGQRGQQRVDWFATLAANPQQWPPEQWRFQRQRTGVDQLHLVVLDTSGSNLRHRGLGLAKGVLARLAEQAYRTRAKLAVLGFGQGGVQLLLPPQRPPKSMRALMNGWFGGGGTPLRAALQRAEQLLNRWRQQHPQQQQQTWIMTDGLTQDALTQLPPIQHCVVIDTEQSRIRRGRGRELAQQLGAQYQLAQALEGV